MRFKNLFQKFLSNTRGNVAIFTVLTMIPLCIAAGGILDVSELVSTKEATQNALDAAALYASASTSSDPVVLQTLTTNAFNVNINGTAGKDSVIQSFSYDASKKEISVVAGGTYQPAFAKIIGISQMPYVATTKTTRQADGTLEVALVLDNTWSMSASLDGTSSKISVLKTAAQNLISTIMTTANAGNVKIAVVPYADYVNVGTGNRGSSWLSVPADYSVTTAGTPAVPGGPITCVTISTKTTTTCTGGTTETYIASYTDGVPNYATRTVGQTCTTKTVSVTPYQSCTQSPAPKAAVAPKTTNYTWYGCVLNLVQGRGAIQLPDPASPYVGTLDTSQKCLNPITPLTTSSSVANAAISSLVVNIGSYKPDTYIPGGLVWGVNVLSPGAPFTDGAAYDPKNKMPRKAIVLMTDGANTEYLLATGKLSTGTTAQLAKTYADQLAICNYAKSKNIEIYTIGFGVTDATSLSTLQSCATDASHYFDASSSAALLAAFTTIAGKLENVRISS